MTIAGFLGVAAGIFMRWGMFFGGGRRDNNNSLPFIVIWLGSIVGLLHLVPADPGAEPLPRAVRRPLGRLPDRQAVGARLGADQDLRRDGPDPDARPARGAGVQRVHVRAGLQPRLVLRRCSPPTRRSSSGWSSWRRSPPTCPGRLPDRLTRWGSSRTSSVAAIRRRPTSTTCSRCRRRRSRSRWRRAFEPTGIGSVCYREAEGNAFATTQADVQALLDADGGPEGRAHQGRLRLHLADLPARPH